MINLNDKPATSENLEYFYKTVFQPLVLGRSNAVLGVQRSGTRSFVKYYLDYSKNIKNKYSKEIKDLNSIYIELDEIESIGELEINEDGKQFLVIINHSELLFENKANIKDELLKIRNKYLMLVEFLFIFNIEVDNTETLTYLNKLGIYEINYNPLRNSDDMLVLLTNEENWFDYVIDNKVKIKIAQLSGGYSSLARGLLDVANQNANKFKTLSTKEILEYGNIQSKLGILWDSLLPNTQELLYSINLKQTNTSRYLKKTNLVSENGLYFSEIFQEYIKQKQVKDIVLQENGLLVYRNTVPVVNILSKQENIAFTEIWKNKEEVVSREQLAKAIWKENWTDKYSDWALDKLISSLRKKLILNKDTLKTIKSKGYLLELDKSKSF